MADLSQNISNTVNCFGGGPSTKWGEDNFAYTMTWGVSKWGQGLLTTDTNNSIPLQIEKIYSESLVPDSTITPGLIMIRSVTSTVTPDSDIGSRYLRDGSQDYMYVFPSNVNDADAQTIPSWSSQSTGAISFTCLAGGSTVWS